MKTGDSPLTLQIKPCQFVPFGLSDGKGSCENSQIQFVVGNTGSAITDLLFCIKQADKVLYSQSLAGLANNHQQSIYWDGFSQQGIYDSQLFTSGQLTAELVYDNGRKQQTIYAQYQRANWLDVKIDRVNKRIDVTLRVNFHNGGVRGKSTQPEQDHFAFLSSLAIAGINHYWSRQQNRPALPVATDVVNIQGQPYRVIVQASHSTERAMSGVNLIYNHSARRLRSSNPGSISGVLSLFAQLLPKRVIYHRHSFQAEESFKLYAAHEIGHEIIKTFAGEWYSYTHEGTSTLLSQKAKHNLVPVTGEVNLMAYYSDRYYDLARTIASERDVLGLLWCAKLNIKNEPNTKVS